MPYRRTSRPYRRRYRRRIGGRRYRTIRRIARRVVNQAAETKFFRQTVTLGQPYTGNPLVYSFADAIAAGTGNAGRIGNQIMCKRISFRLAAQHLNTATVGGSVRVSVVYPRKSITADTNWISALGVGVLSDFDPATTYVLYDQIFFIEASNPTYFNGATPSVRYFRFSKRVYFKYNFASNVVNREALLIIQSNNSSSATAPLVNGYLRLSYKDI